MKIKLIVLIVGIGLGIFGSAAGLLVSPQLHGIEREFRCVGCHGQLHAAVQLDSLPYNALVNLTGDVTKPGFVTVNDVFPYRVAEPRSISLAQFVEVYGNTTDFDQIVLVSTDGGRVTLDRKYVTDKSLLVPFLEGVRFTDENQHVSTWLKGIDEIIVVGKERPVRIDGRDYTMGGLLAGRVVTVSTEGGKAMKANLKTDAVFSGEYAHLQKGAPIAALVAEPAFGSLEVTDGSGQSTRVPRERGIDAVLALVDGQTTLVLPGESRRAWVFGVREVRSSK